MLRLFLTLLFSGLFMQPSTAAVVWRTYSFFTVGGTTLEQIMAEFHSRGPHLASTGQRHPGATKLSFNARTGYTETDRRCRITEAEVTVKARIILPKWKDRRKASRELRIYWDALAADIKRHEEAHVVIAKKHARELEAQLLALPRRRVCDLLAKQAEHLMERALQGYFKESEQFDRVESLSFGKRMEALYNYRIERIESGRLPEP